MLGLDVCFDHLVLIFWRWVLMLNVVGFAFGSMLKKLSLKILNSSAVSLSSELDM